MTTFLSKVREACQNKIKKFVEKVCKPSLKKMPVGTRISGNEKPRSFSSWIGFFRYECHCSGTSILGATWNAKIRNIGLISWPMTRKNGSNIAYRVFDNQISGLPGIWGRFYLPTEKLKVKFGFYAKKCWKNGVHVECKNKDLPEKMPKRLPIFFWVLPNTKNWIYEP